MKRLIALALLATHANAATISVDLGAVKRAIVERHQRIPKTVRLRRLTAALAASASVADIVTTNRGLARGRCEVNPLLVGSDGCSINRTRFTALKVGVLLWLGPGEELAHKLPHGAIWDRENIVINSVLAVGYGVVAARNEGK